MRFHCRVCGWRSDATPEVRVLFHPCRPIKGRRRRVELTAFDDDTADDLAAFRAKTFTGPSALGDRAQPEGEDNG